MRGPAAYLLDLGNVGSEGGSIVHYEEHIGSAIYAHCILFIQGRRAIEVL